MDETLPVLSGVMVGLLVTYLVAARWRVRVLACLSLIAGAAASWINGELQVSWVYLMIDTAQVAIAGFLTWTLVAQWRRRRRNLRQHPVLGKGGSGLRMEAMRPGSDAASGDWR